MKLFGIGGSNGSGKDTVAAVLAERYGFLAASATEMLVEELKKRGWPIDRKHKSKISAEWRREFGMGVIVDKAVELFNQQPGKYNGLSVGSLRHPGETDRLHEMGGKQIWVDADPKIRYERIQKNLHERQGTHAEEGVSFEDFIKDEQREMTPEGDEATLNMAGVKEKSDIFLTNNGNSIEEFKSVVEIALGLRKN